VVAVAKQKAMVNNFVRYIPGKIKTMQYYSTKQTIKQNVLYKCTVFADVVPSGKTTI
jgi:hypothetical protein